MCFLYFCVFFPMLDCQNWLLVETPGHQKLILSSAIISHEPILVGWNVKINLFETQMSYRCNKGTRLRGIPTVNGTRLDDPWYPLINSWPALLAFWHASTTVAATFSPTSRIRAVFGRTESASMSTWPRRIWPRWTGKDLGMHVTHTHAIYIDLHRFT